MNANSPARVISMIDAMRTLTENFPMSILDIRQGTTYTSIFMFLIDVLQACGVNIYDIVSRLFESVYGIGVKLDGGIATIYDTIDKIDINEQSKLLQVIEDGIKDIILALLTSIFTCSANPVIPNWCMDYSEGLDEPDLSKFKEYINKAKLLANEDSGIEIPVGLFDFYGAMSVNPFSEEGKLYFNIEGGDKFYEKKTQKIVIGYETNPDDKVQKPKDKKYVKLYLDFGEGHDDATNEYRLTAEDELVFCLSEPIEDTLYIVANYRDADNMSRTEKFEIRPGETKSNVFFISPTSPLIRDGERVKEYLINAAASTVSYRNSDTGKIFSKDDIVIYWDREMSKDVINYWHSVENDSLTSEEGIQWYEISKDTEEYDEFSLSDFRTETEMDFLYYEEVEKRDEVAIRVPEVPTNPTEDDPDYIVCYEGLDPNTMYRTNDMDAFLWYIYNRSNYEPQYEDNKNVWDSRYSARKKGIEREGDTEWNCWLNSKVDENDTFKLYEDCENENPQKEVENPEIYPIIHLERNNDSIRVLFSSQTYFKPKWKKDEEDIDGKVFKYYRFNENLYRFNRDYLNNIQILNPKRILYGMVDSLLNGALTAFLSVRPNITKKKTETMLSLAIKKYVEAEDAEVEDCYFTFSNEEFDEMLNEMLLARYSATYMGGEANLTKTHDIIEYINTIDQVNFTSSSDGEITKINKIVTEVTTTPSVEGSIDYGIEFSVDKGLWNRLVWAMALPMIEALFTPKVVLLFLINFRIMGIANYHDLLDNEQSKIITIITNKIFVLVRSIISFIKDKIAEILFDMAVEEMGPLVADYLLIILKERMDAWIGLLKSALRCMKLNIIGFRRNKEIGAIDDVNYADIINDQTRPETKDEC